MKALSSRWKWFLSLALLVGTLLRLTYVNDMEWKEDEEYNFLVTQRQAQLADWPWSGMASGVYLKNPGMSVWVFMAAARLFGADTPTELARAVQLISLLGICLILPFIFFFLKKEEEREPWLWAYVLALVNPFLVYVHRKLWPQPFLPLFTMLTLMGWWKRGSWAGAFFWGMLGAWLGQIHMSGFFFAFSLFAWTAVFERRLANTSSEGTRTNWKGWFLGSVVGALPLIPWALQVLKRPPAQTAGYSWTEAIQLKYWVFWMTDPTGLTLANPIGVLRGSSLLHQISDFIRYPLVGGQPTYLNALAHLVILAIFLLALIGLRRGLWKERSRAMTLFVGSDSPTAFVQNSAFWGCGALLTATGVAIRRYYLMVTFPLEFLWLIRALLANLGRHARALLFILWLAQLIISACFVGYVHVNQGSDQGDYGPAYHRVKDLPRH